MPVSPPVLFTVLIPAPNDEDCVCSTDQASLRLHALAVELPVRRRLDHTRGNAVTIMRTTLKIREICSRYLFIILYVWLEKFFSCGNYRQPTH